MESQIADYYFSLLLSAATFLKYRRRSLFLFLYLSLCLCLYLCLYLYLRTCTQ